MVIEGLTKKACSLQAHGLARTREMGVDHEIEPEGDDLGPFRGGEVVCPEENVSDQENRESRALAF